MLCTLGVDNTLKTAAHFRGYVCLNEKHTDIEEIMAPYNLKHEKLQKMCEDDIEVKILFDTGALCANYMSEDLFEDIRRHINNDNITQQQNRIALADDSKVITSNYLVRLNIRVEDRTGNVIQYDNGSFVVINMKDNDLIIGLPSILTHFWQFFKNALENAVSTIQGSETPTAQNMSAVLASMLNSSDLLDPWMNVPPDEAPEEQEVPLPTQFEHASNFLGKTRAEALEEYYAMFNEHISKEIIAETPIVDLLKTKGVNVFVPQNWEGIKGIDPLHIDFSDDLPDRLKPKARPINPRLWECAEKEFNRLKTYFYEPSRSPHASCLVVAPKATKPFIRFCGDYGVINKYLPTGHYNIPIIRHELDRIIGHKVYIDIDLTNAFHQIPLHPDTKAKLSVQTPWGQYQPKFMPEGIGPGSAVLQETVRTLFSHFSWAIVIFDNILILAEDFQQAYERFEMFLDKCIEHNVVLKFAKSWIGFSKVSFFGYECTHSKMELSDDRKKAILDIPFPEEGNRNKKVRSLLGSGVMFSPFVDHYSDLVANLPDMTKATFNWDETSWKHDYRKQYDDFKQGLQKACALYYPDYALEWILRTDASDYGIGVVLLQVKLVDGTRVYQPIAFWSKKFSAHSLIWATIEKEGYAIFAGVHRFAYYLVGKSFIIETDHNNLRWMEASEVPKIVRWRVYLQSFDFKIRHIKGSNNTVADALSRLFLLQHPDPSPPVHFSLEDHSLSCLDALDWECVEPQTLCSVFNPSHTVPTVKTRHSSTYEVEKKPSAPSVPLTADSPTNNDTSAQEPPLNPELHTPLELQLTARQMFEEIHKSTPGHWGLRETWKKLNSLFPGHGLPMQAIAEWISECPNCQKTRKERSDALIPMVRHLKPPHARTAVGIDSLAITPHGPEGHTHILVIVNLFTKFAYLVSSKGCTALNLAQAVWQYWCNFGCTDMIISDRGSDLTSDLFAELVNLVGLRHVFSIADKHANGTERLIKEAQRHLRAIVYDSRVEDVFTDPTVIPCVQYIMNSHTSSETSFTPFELMFGSEDLPYTQLLDDTDPGGIDITHSFLRKLNANLAKLRTASQQYQAQLVAERQGGEKSKEVPNNTYQAGDFVTFDSGPKPHPKMSCRYKGPYEVVKQYRNDVDCRNMITGAIVQYSLSDLQPFFCHSRDEAFDAAMRDQQQFMVKRIVSYTGDSRTRTSMTFKVEFVDGDIRSLPWSPDLLCEEYYKFCESRPYLFHLTLDTRMAKKWKTQLNRQDISAVKPGDLVYLDLRFFGDAWYESLQLPDFDTTSYVMEMRYTKWYHKSSKRKITGNLILLTQHSYSLDGYLVHCWGSVKVFDPSTMVLVNDDMIKRYPNIAQD